ncbi:hypothetical protein CBR_g70744 [Chara braunii]|uniref:Seipin n=1 Tax=Chara braunii TaxID=69332 RepID=A0A388K9Y5_CHABU|nr:hypothetical protein CBR_g70744 [Chara braunii]|eukprot:GBG66868.1 hypothetical protein CBR_g70744 [Chara braunii]
MAHGSETSEDLPELEDERGNRAPGNYWELGGRDRGRGISSSGTTSSSYQGARGRGGGGSVGTGVSTVISNVSGRSNSHLDGGEMSSSSSRQQQLHEPPAGMVTNLSMKLTHGVVACSLVGLVFIVVIASSLPVYLFVVWQFAPSVVKTTQPLYFDYRLPSPTATVPLLPPDKLASSQAAKSPTHGPRPIPVGQKVNVWVCLKLPDSYTNRELGVFQVTVQLLSSHEDVLAQSTRPSIMRFRSLPVRLVRSALLLMPIVCGFIDDDQDIKLHVIKGYVEREVPVAMIRVMLDARAGMSLKEGLPEVYGADLIVDTTPRGVRAFVHRWKLTSFVWGAFGLLFVEIIVLLRCCRWALIPKIWSKRADKQEPSPPTAHAVPVSEHRPRPSATPSTYERVSLDDNEEMRAEDVEDDNSSSESEFEYDDELAKMLFEQRLLNDMGSREGNLPCQEATRMDGRLEIRQSEGREDEGAGGGEGREDEGAGGEEEEREEEEEEEEGDEDEEEDEEEEVALKGERWVKIKGGSSSLRNEQSSTAGEGRVATQDGFSEASEETEQAVHHEQHDHPTDDVGRSSLGNAVDVAERGASDDSGAITSSRSEGSISCGDPYSIGTPSNRSTVEKGKGLTSDNDNPSDAHVEEEQLYHGYEDEGHVHRDDRKREPKEPGQAEEQMDRMYTESEQHDQSALLERTKGGHSEQFVSAAASQISETSSEDMESTTRDPPDMVAVTEEEGEMDAHGYPLRVPQQGLRRRKL